ncbi:hypothetical protein EPO33_04980 [Patescibacteria group bacterium]|nr:MAG: hypothetical protein EPO33_04980 [Patescibacteria group bacterium]
MTRKRAVRIAVLLTAVWCAAGCREEPRWPVTTSTPRIDCGPAVGDAGTSEADAGFALSDAGTAAGDAAADGAPPADGGPPPRCIGSYAEGVALFAAETYVVLRAHVDPEETAEITAWPWQTSLGSVRPVAREVEWRTEGDAAMFRTEPLADPRERRLRLAVAGDAFDMGGREPYLTVRACVRNGCPAAAADGSPCRCEEEVCSPIILAAAVPSLDGRWSFSEDGAEMGAFDIRQSGRVLSGLPYDFPFNIEGVGVQGGELGILVTGAVAPDRRSISGLRFTEDGDVIGPWSARRAD